MDFKSFLIGLLCALLFALTLGAWGGENPGKYQIASALGAVVILNTTTGVSKAFSKYSDGSMDIGIINYEEESYKNIASFVER